jgi:hypothetical protein
MLEKRRKGQVVLRKEQDGELEIGASLSRDYRRTCHFTLTPS